MTRWIIAATLFLSWAPGVLASAEKWNVLLITVDTLRADRLESYGYQKGETGSFSRLASKGAVFERALAPTPLTLPSHTSILTGAYPLSHGIRDNAGFVLPKSQTTLAEALSSSGYASGAFVGAFVLDARFGLDQGFETYVSDFDLTGLDVVAPGLIQKKASQVAERALGWIDAQSAAGNPFFAWVHFYDPHDPYEPPEPFAARFRSSPYDGEIAYVDSVLGRILDYLHESGLESRTLVVLTSDHGESLGEHGEKTHGYYIYQSTQHVPLIWASPDGKSAGKRIEETVRLIDIAPTILRWLNLAVPETMQGTSLLGLMAGRPSGHRESYLETYYPNLQFGWSPLRCLYRHPFKYIQAPRPELYNLEDDPAEAVNLYDSNRSMANSLSGLLRDAVHRYTPGGASQSSSPVDAETAQALASLGYSSISSASLPEEDISGLADPKDKIGLYNQLLDAYSQLSNRQLAAAVSTFRRILEEDPQATFVYRSLGSAYSRMGRHQEALAAFERASESYPQDPLLHFNRGNTLLRLGRMEEAASAFEKTLQIDPGHFRARSNLASLWIQQGRFQDSLSASVTILQKHPRYEQALFNAAVSLLALGRSEQAVPYLKRVLEVNPANTQARRHLEAIPGK